MKDFNFQNKFQNKNTFLKLLIAVGVVAVAAFVLYKFAKKHFKCCNKSEDDCVITVEGDEILINGVPVEDIEENAEAKENEDK